MKCASPVSNWHLAARGGVPRFDGRDESADLEQGRQVEIEEGGYLLYDSTPSPLTTQKTLRRSRHRRHRRAANHRMYQQGLEGTIPRERQLLKNVDLSGCACRHCSVSGPGVHRGTDPRKVQRQRQAHRSANMKARRTWPFATAEKENLAGKCRVGLIERHADSALATASSSPVTMQRQRSARSMVVPPSAPGIRSRHPLRPGRSLHGAILQGRIRVDPVNQGTNKFAIVQAEDEIAAIGMVLGARTGTARAPLPRPPAPAFHLMQEFFGLAYLRRSPRRGVRHSAWRPLHRHADAHTTDPTSPCSLLTPAHGDTKHVMI